MPKPTGASQRLTRRELRDLDIEIGFLEGLMQRDPHNCDVLQVLGDDYTRRGKFIDGLKIDEQLCKLRPNDPTVLYNLGCSYALTRRFEKAAAALIRAIESGYTDFRWISRDPDLQVLRKHPIYEEVQAKIKSVRVRIS